MPEETFESFVQRLHTSQMSFDELAQICFKLKQESKAMKDILTIIWETDALQEWAWEDPEGEGSIADWVRKYVKNIAEQSHGGLRMIQ